jgi:hypothetical protein
MNYYLEIEINNTSKIFQTNLKAKKLKNSKSKTKKIAKKTVYSTESD